MSAVEDLFGDDVVVENGSGNGDRPSANDADERQSNGIVSDEDDLFGDTEAAANEHEIPSDEEHEDVRDIITEFKVANFKQPIGDDGSIFLAKMPSFLDVDPYAFDPDTLLLEIQQSSEATVDTDEKMTKKRSLVNTLRWRPSSDSNGDDTRVSNGRFVKWSDGTMSLQVGDELFDVPVKNMEKEHNYLTMMHAEEGLLRSMQRFVYSMSFQPYGLSSKSHAELKADIARRAISSKGRTVKLHTEMIDPADFQKQAIKADNEKQKARRRLDNQKARTMNASNGSRERTHLTARYLDENESDEELGIGQRYKDDNDDGFVVDDEDSENGESGGGSRLQAVKEAGAAAYRDRKKRTRSGSEDDVSEDESIVYEDDAGDDLDDEEEAVMTPKNEDVAPEDESRNKKPKRRIVDSDDED